ncbi:barstar family protein [Kribbella sp. NPDC051620]|uniref:barstar family protein n=1 Tax=Kribbella sp. NPDC051620 TaxID=3364120 RepID=UPI00379AC943
MTFLMVHEVNTDRRQVDESVLKIRSSRSGKIGEYSIGRVVRKEISQASGRGIIPNVTYKSFGAVGEFPEAARIWIRWVSEVPLDGGEWINMSPSFQAAWLDVVQKSWFATSRGAARYGPSAVVELEGTQISSRTAFYCALGEAINGPGGYYGSSLDGLADCIRSSFGEGPPSRISWRDFQSSAESRDRAYLKSILDVLDEFHIELVTN